MKRGMTHAARAELADAIRGRYLAATGKDKRKILHEFIAATGYHEKSAIRILNGPVAVKLRKSPPTYTALRRGRTRCPHRHVGGLRSGVWQTPQGTAANFAAGVGAQWASKAASGNPLKAPVDECCDHRPSTPDAKERITYQKAAEGCAGAATAHQNAHLCRLE